MSWQPISCPAPRTWPPRHAADAALPPPRRGQSALGPEIASGTDLLEEPVAEGREVIRLAAGHEFAVDIALRVDPRGAGVGQIGAKARPAGQRTAVDDAGFDERPRTVADS